MKTLKNSKARWIASLILLVAAVIALAAWPSAPAPEAEACCEPGKIIVATPKEISDMPQSPLAHPHSDGPSLCPGEDIDRQGYNEAGGNDFWGYKYPPTVVTPTHIYSCTGWIHKDVDVDHVHFRTTEADLGRTLVARLTDLPKDYSLTYIAPLNADRGFITDRGTQDKVLEFSVEHVGVYAIKVVSRSYPPDFVPPEYDPDEPYLFTLEWKDER